jgi:hypothetical protein
VATLLVSSWLAACGQDADPKRARDLLVVIPGAADVQSSQGTVSYKVNDRYPAESTIKSLSDALAQRQCTVSERDPLNADPVLRLNEWTEHTPPGGGATTLSWNGAWSCQPMGDVVIFGSKPCAARSRR